MTSLADRNPNIKSYEFNAANKIAKQASDDVTKFLNKLPITVKVENVENDPFYQGKDIDLVWHHQSASTGKIETKTIEIKGDRYDHTGNYFFETVSNVQKNTPGCFMYTQADWIFYYFVKPRIVHLIPTIETRNWFIQNQNRFPEATTSTTSKNGILYTSKGRKVPRRVVSQHIKIEKFDLNPYIS